MVIVCNYWEGKGKRGEMWKVCLKSFLGPKIFCCFYTAYLDKSTEFKTRNTSQHWTLPCKKGLHRVRIKLFHPSKVCFYLHQAQYRVIHNTFLQLSNIIFNAQYWYFDNIFIWICQKEKQGHCQMCNELYNITCLNWIGQGGTGQLLQQRGKWVEIWTDAKGPFSGTCSLSPAYVAIDGALSCSKYLEAKFYAPSWKKHLELTFSVEYRVPCTFTSSFRIKLFNELMFCTWYRYSDNNMWCNLRDDRDDYCSFSWSETLFKLHLVVSHYS